MLAHAMLVLLAWHPDLVVWTLTLQAATVGVWKYRSRPWAPAPHPCVRVSMAEAPDRDELDEEFDSTPPRGCRRWCGCEEDAEVEEIRRPEVEKKERGGADGWGLRRFPHGHVTVARHADTETDTNISDTETNTNYLEYE
uniref:Multiple C2 domain-containing protein n=1 Tax=Oryza brachyantha TaxID=4533 RepID=J3LQU4_ORYBR